MKTLKKIYEQNKAIIISTVILVLCAEVVNALIAVGFNEPIDVDFALNEALKILGMIFGVVAAYVFISRLKEELSPVIALFCVVGMSVSNYYCCTGRFAYDTLVMSCLSVVAVYFLAVYYLSRCRDSVLHMIFYILINLQFCYITAGNINAFFGYGLQVLLFVRFNRTIKNKHVRIANIVYSFNSICWIITLFISNIYDYFTFEFIEGHKMVLVNDVIETVKPFGKTEKVNEIIDFPYLELTKISGLFGYVFGIAVIIVVTAFIFCIYIKVCKNREKVQPALLTLAAVTGIQYLSYLVNNFGILFGEMDTYLPVISDGVSGYILIGTLLGLTFVEANKDAKNNSEMI